LFSLRIQQQTKSAATKDDSATVVPIGDGTGASKDADTSGERGFKRGFAGLPQTFNQRRLFSANVSTSTAMEMNIVSRTANVLSNQTSSVSLMDSFIENGYFIKVFSANVK
jgi:hypothetical protein